MSEKFYDILRGHGVDDLEDIPEDIPKRNLLILRDYYTRLINSCVYESMIPVYRVKLQMVNTRLKII